MTVGSVLADARTELGLSLEALSAQTRIRAGLIAAIEVDNYQAAGGQAYLRGHVKVIATALGFSATEIEQLLALLQPATTDSLTSDLAQSNLTPSRQSARLTPSFSFLSYAAVAILGLVILVPSATSVFKSHASAKHSVKISQKIPLKNSPVKVAANSAPVNPVANTLVITATNGASWLAVSDSTGTSLFSGMLQIGESQSFDSGTNLNVTVGNSGAVDIVNAGRDLGAPGATGVVTHLQFGPGLTSLQTGAIQG